MKTTIDNVDVVMANEVVYLAVKPNLINQVGESTQSSKHVSFSAHWEADIGFLVG